MRGVQDVTFVAFDRFQSLDLTGPLEVLNTAPLLLPEGEGYRTRVVAPAPVGAESTSNRRRQATARSSSGLEIVVDATPIEPAERIDTLVVVGGLGADAAAADPALLSTIRVLAARAGRITSVCTGALVLAAAGLLEGRRATTHWSACARLAEEHPDVDVDPDAIFVRDGEIWTSAGVTAGMDLALALVAEDHGSDVAHAVAGWLVMFVQRAGGQSQFSPQLTPVARATPLRDLQAWIIQNLDGDLSVQVLARRASMSERHLTRLFGAELGTTPAAYVESVRIDAARRLLESTDLTVAAVAERVGFRSDAVLHRAFGRTVRTTPGSYRRHFATSTRS